MKNKTKSMKATKKAKYSVFHWLGSKYLGEFTLDEIYEKWEESPLKISHERQTVYILH